MAICLLISQPIRPRVLPLNVAVRCTLLKRISQCTWLWWFDFVARQDVRRDAGWTAVNPWKMVFVVSKGQVKAEQGCGDGHASISYAYTFVETLSAVIMRVDMVKTMILIFAFNGCNSNDGCYFVNFPTVVVYISVSCWRPKSWRSRNKTLHNCSFRLLQT